jgi:hypothetical protein
VKHKIYIISLFILIALLFNYVDVEAQCAMCKQAVKSNMESSEEGRKIGIGLNSGILYLMAVPYLIFATIAFAFFRKQIVTKVQTIIKK